MNTATILNKARHEPDSLVVFIGQDHCAIHDGDIGHPVTLTVALAAVQMGRMSKTDRASNGVCYFT